jgi:hypothetical protein
MLSQHNNNKYDDYMLTGKMLISALKYNHTTISKTENDKIEKQQKQQKEQKEQNNVVVAERKKKDSSFFIPQEKDGLFWCFYVIKYGFAAYEYPGTTSFVNEKTVKFNLIEELRKKKQILKTKKIKNIKEEVEDDLANKNKIGMKTFIALCAAENINVLFIHKRKCFELMCEEDNPFHVIHWRENPEKYCYEIDGSKETLDKYRTTLFKWESLEKPLKAMSSYKVDELLDLCKKLGLEEKLACLSKKTKKDLYELLIMNI